MALDRITFNPRMMQGQACIRGMRLTVSLILSLIASGMTTKEIIEEYPDVEEEDITQCLFYASMIAKEEYHSLMK